MRNHINRYFELYVILGVFVGGILLIALAAWIVPRIDANSLRHLGYEAKAVNFDCFAKYEGRWRTCTAVAHHSVEITQ